MPASASSGVSATHESRTHNPAAIGSRSLDLLIDLQPRAGLDFNERLRRENTPRISDAAAPANAAGSRPPKSETAGGLFGGGATPLVNSRKVTNETSFDASAGRNVRAANWRDDGGASASDSPLKWLLPRELLVYVRDNREMVAVIAVILLLLIWAGSVVLVRRR